MARVEYKLYNFNAAQASSGKLCVMVSSAVSVTSGTTVITNIGTDGSPTSGFGGAGICKNTGSNEYTVVINGIAYAFNQSGLPANAAARNAGSGAYWTLWVGENLAYIVSAGVDVVGTTYSQDGVTRGSTTPGSDIEYGTDTAVVVDNMTPRDQFAAQALRGMLSHIDDPSTLSNSEMQLYCDAAYQWAANMMTAAANSRVAVNDGSASTTAEVEEIGTLDNNTDKLLNNIIVALERTDSSVGVWKKTGQNDVAGAYTDAVAQSLPNSGTAYTGIAAAQADGWSWVGTFAEKISAPDVESKLNAINASIGANPTATTPVTLINALDAIKTAITSGSSGGGGGTVIIDNGNTTDKAGGASNPFKIAFAGAGTGTSAQYPLFIQGGTFPSKAALAAELYGDTDHGQVSKAEDFLAFNYNGAVGWISAAELFKRLQSTLLAAVSSWLAGSKVTVSSTDYNVTYPNLHA